jgi:hypothetical protein
MLDGREAKQQAIDLRPEEAADKEDANRELIC